MPHAVNRRGLPTLGRAGLFVTLAAIAAMLGACADSATAPQPGSSISGVAEASSSYNGGQCTAPTVVPLVAEPRRDQQVNVGTVAVNNRGSTLDVTFATAEGWKLTSTAVVVAGRAEDIAKRLRKDRDAKFPGVVQHNGITTYTVSIPLSEVGQGEDGSIVVVAYATVAGALRDGNATRQVELAAWGRPSSSREREDVRYFNYRVRQCADQGGQSGENNNEGEHDRRSRGYATITFDDGYLSTYTTAYPILRRYHLAANIAINSRPIDERWVGYMTLDMVRQLSASGWAVVNHTVDHRDLQTLTPAEVAQEISVNRAWIDARGFRGSSVFVVPFHSWSSRELPIVRQYSVAARGAAANQFRPNPRDSLVTWPATANPYGLTALEPLAPGADFATSLSDLRRYLAMVRRNGRFIDVFFHRVEPADVGRFEQIVRVLAEYRDVIRTYDQLFPVRGRSEH